MRRTHFDGNAIWALGMCYQLSSDIGLWQGILVFEIDDMKTCIS